jgi:hypothetical protein
VPPIFQPEVAADAIVWAAENPRFEVYVGGSTVMTILGNKIAPRLLDRHLARHGYQSQQTNGLVEPDRPDNLWKPVAGDHGAHGAFDHRARPRSLQFSLLKHRWLALGTVGVGVVAATARWLRPHSHR